MEKTIMSCIENDDVVGLEELLKAGADVNSGFGDAFLFNTNLMNAVRAGNAEIVKLLLDCGAKVNIVSRNSDSALNIAVENENIEIVKILLEAGADVNIRSRYCYPPLITAV